MSDRGIDPLHPDRAVAFVHRRDGSGDRERRRRRRSWGLLTGVRVVADASVFMLSFAASFAIYTMAVGRGWIERPLPAVEPYVAIAIVFATVALFVFWQQGLYRGRATVLNLWELETAVKGTMLAAALLFALLFFLDLDTYSRYVVVGALGLSAVLVIAERRVLGGLIRRLLLMGRFGRRTCIYGCERTGQLLMKKIVQAPHLGRTVVGFLDDHVPIGGHVCCRITQTDDVLFEAPVLGRMEHLERVVTEGDVDELLVAERAVSAERLRDILALCRELDLAVGVVPNLGDDRSDQLKVEDLSAIPVLRPYAAGSRRVGGWVKRGFDLSMSSVLVILTVPIWLAAAVLIRLGSRGPALFAQERVGRDGVPFKMFKFRTMRSDSQPYASSPSGDDVDPRITRIGRILRRTGLDELPQLLNVLRSEMSLVGPRPEMPHIVQKYSPVERQRLGVTPGITGLWQISADRHAEIHENIEYDLYYVSHQSLLLDLLILLETVFFTLGVAARSISRPSKPSPLDVQPDPERRVNLDDPFVLVVLDQRSDGRSSSNWRTFIPMIYEISNQWSVRLVVAEGNIGAVDALLAEPIQRLGADGFRTSYVSYGSHNALRRLVREARLVVTDLEHIAAWSREDRIDLLEVVDGGACWWPQSRIPDPIVSLLAEKVTVFVGPGEDVAVGFD